MFKELKKMVDELNTCLDTKKKEIDEVNLEKELQEEESVPNSYVEGEFMNVKTKILIFEDSCEKASVANPFEQGKVISNFKKDAAKIKDDIDKIK